MRGKREKIRKRHSKGGSEAGEDGPKAWENSFQGDKKVNMKRLRKLGGELSRRDYNCNIRPRRMCVVEGLAEKNSGGGRFGGRGIGM